MKNTGAILQLLIERDGVDINARDNEGMTPLIWAAYGGNESVARLLIERGADMNATDNRGMTALLVVAMSPDEATVRLLIERGVDTNAMDSEGKTPLMWAAIHERDPIARLLVAVEALHLTPRITRQRYCGYLHHTASCTTYHI